MNSKINYNDIRDSLSIPRIRAYQQFFTGHTDQEIYGIYLWNKALCSAIYPLLQAAEIALRNAIDTAARVGYGDYWHEKIPHTPFKSPHSGKMVNDQNYTRLLEQFSAAERRVTQRSAAKGSTVRRLRPDFNSVVAETNFVTWEYALHNCFFKVGDKNFLWPTKSKSVFKNWPHQSAKQTHSRLYDLVSEIRPFRNRLSHHEPLWKGINVRSEADAIAFLTRKIDTIGSLLFIISDEKVKYLNLQNFFARARSLSSKSSLDKFRYRLQSRQLSLKHRKKVRAFLSSIHDGNCPYMFEYAGKRFVIEPG